MARLRALYASATALLVVGVVGAPALADTEDVCPPPGETASDQFTDDDGNLHEPNVNCMSQYGIAAGTGDGEYSPGATVTRAQMASFVANFVRTAGADLPDGPDAFTDDDGNIHEANINALAAAGIVSGTGDATYTPGGEVTRAQMATFIANAIGHVTGSALPEGSDAFTDDDGSIHEDSINALAAAGVVAGTGGTSYSPAAPVIRAQMASFIMQGAGYLHDQDAWAPTKDGTGEDLLPPALTSLLPTDTPLAGVLDTGDTIELVLDEPVTAAEGATLTLTGTAGTLATLVLGGNTQLTQPSPDRLVFEVTGLVASVPWLVDGVDLTDVQGVTDLAGNPFELAGPISLVDGVSGVLTGGDGGGTSGDGSGDGGGLLDPITDPLAGSLL